MFDLLLTQFLLECHGSLEEVSRARFGLVRNGFLELLALLLFLDQRGELPSSISDSFADLHPAPDPSLIENFNRVLLRFELVDLASDLFDCVDERLSLAP